VTAERIERIVREHLIEGRPIGEWVLRRLCWSAQALDLRGLNC
jgi:(2Fe-2S) ferredoxin